MRDQKWLMHEGLVCLYRNRGKYVERDWMIACNEIKSKINWGIPLTSLQGYDFH